jgi:uncharacterized protein (DUF3084 family)
VAYTVLFFAILIAVSGLIAYLGDWIGRRMGKRRLTLFGMRPRHTAIVVTTITGMLIAGLTLAILLTVDSSMREVIYHGRQAIKNYQVKNKELEDRNTALVTTRAKLSVEVREKSKQVEIARKEADDAVKARNDVRKRVDGLQREIRSRQAELNKLKAAGKLTGEKLAQITAGLEDRKQELSLVRSDLVKKDRELAAKLQDLSEKTDELSQKKEELQDKERSIAEAGRKIDQQEQTIQAQGKALMEATQVRAMFLTNDVVLPFGQETGRKVIDDTMSVRQVKAELAELLTSSNAEMKRRHPDLGSGSKAIRLVIIDNKRNAIYYPKDDDTVLDGAAQAIVELGKRTESRVVISRLVVVNNTLKGEVAPVEINLYPNNMSFRRGENIASRLIDGRMSEGRILLAVNDFLGEDVRAAAQKAGVFPVASPDPDQADEQMSARELELLMEVVEKIKSENTPVELHAKAKKDIFAVGPLDMDNIQFTISELTSAQP